MAKRRNRTRTPGDGIPDAPTIGDLKRYLVRLIRAVHAGRVDVKEANCLGQLANALIGAIVDHELEIRVEELEQQRAAGQFSDHAASTSTITAEGTA